MQKASGLRLTLPLPPSINAQYATVKGRRVSTAVARLFKEQVKAEITRLRIGTAIPEQVWEALRRSYLSLFLDFYFETPLRRDLDGGLKITQDAICEALGINDNRVVDIHLVKRIAPLHPRLEVQLEPIQDWQFDEEYIYLQPEKGTPT